MKKINLFLGLAVAMLTIATSCEKNDTPVQGNEVTIGVTYEPIANADTKVSIVENSTNFSLNWEGTEKAWLGSSANTNMKSTFTIPSFSGNNATFQGEYPTISNEITTTDYFFSVSTFGSRADHNESPIYHTFRGEISKTQNYNGNNLGSYVFLVGVQRNCTVNAISESFALKTMNSFMQISLTKGSPAAGSSNEYTNMFVQSIKIETIEASEQLSGRFAIDITSDSWMNDYYPDPAINSTDKYNSILLNCVSDENPNGIELSNTSNNFYITIPFGTFSKGFKATINVINQDGDFGKYEKTISSGNPIAIERNTLVKMPSIPVNPVDVIPETYDLISSKADLTAGNYYMAAYVNNLYHLFSGTMSSNTGGHMVTASYSYNSSTKVLTGENAVLVTLESAGEANQYYIKYNGKYLATSEGKAGKLIFYEDAQKQIWVAKDRATPAIELENSSFSEHISICSALSASSNYLRGYKTTSSSSQGGIFFFKLR